MILIFSNKEDSHPTNVIKHLTQWGVDVFRFNTECLLTDYRFNWHCDKDCVGFEIENIKTGLMLNAAQVTAVWDRRAWAPSALPFPNDKNIVNRFMKKEAYAFLSFLRHWMKDIYSIGDIVEDWPADSKMLQLTIARELGMAIPETCFSNYKNPVAQFASHHDTLLLKAISTCDVYDEKEDADWRPFQFSRIGEDSDGLVISDTPQVHLSSL